MSGPAFRAHHTYGRVAVAIPTAARENSSAGDGACQDGRHAQRVADLTIYIRQSHAERDLAELGRRAGRQPLGAG